MLSIMSYWKKQFNLHPVHEKTTELENFLKKDALIEEDTNSLNIINRISTGLTSIHQHLENANYELAPQQEIVKVIKQTIEAMNKDN